MGCGPSKLSKSKKSRETEREARGGHTDGVLDESHESQDYDPVLYENDQAMIRDPHRLVTQLHFVAQTILQSGGNHWGMNLQTGLNQSIRLNMDPSNVLGAQAPNHGYRGQLRILHQDDAVSHDQHTIITIPVHPGHSAAEFIDVIIKEGNHLYDFTTTGRGCTGWMLDQFNLFERYHLIPGGHDIAKNISQQWDLGHVTKTDIGITHGTYMRDTTYGGWAGRAALRRR